MNKDDIKKNLKVIEFKKPPEEKVPEFVTEMLELILEQSKKGTLRTIVCHFTHEPDTKEEDPHAGGTLFWNHNHNPLEILGLLEIMKSVALDYTHAVMHDEGDEE